MLQLNLNPSDPAEVARAEAAYQQMYGAPLEGQIASDLSQGGQSYGSYGGALMGQTRSANTLNAYLAGREKLQQDYNNLLSARQSYYGGAPQLVTGQNAADVSRGLGVAGLQQGAANAQNQYNLSSTGAQNQFNQGNYGAQLGAIGLQQAIAAQQRQQRSNNTFGLGALGLGALQTGLNYAGPIGSGLGRIFGSGSPQAGIGQQHYYQGGQNPWGGLQ